MKKTLVLAILAGVMWISPPEVCAVNYYVDATGGNDTNNGQSDATAWRTIGKVNNYTFQTGDNVFFKCGGTWTGTYLFVDWSGSANDRVIIGAYYMDGGNEVYGISGNRPIIDGNDTAPTDNYDGLITIENREYITVENIHIKRSAGYGVWNYRSDNTFVDNIYIKRTYMQGVYFYNSNNCTLQHSDVSETCRYGNGSVVAFRDSNNILIQYNTLHETSNEQIIMNSGREGINFLHSDNSVAIGNIIYDCKGLGIYLDHAQYATVKNNLIYYTDNTDYWRSNTKPSPGIVFTDEAAQGSDHLARDITVVGNLIANCGEGITLWSGPLNTNDPALINVVIANNTIVEPCSTDGSHRSLLISSSARHSNSIIKNNVFWQSTGQIAYAPADPDLVFSNNLWSQPQVDVDNDAKGPGDVYGRVPYLTKTTGWNSLTAGSLDGSEFALQSNSPAIDVGISLGAEYAEGLDPFSVWPDDVSTLNQNDYGTGWEIGAYVFTGVACLPIEQTGWVLVHADSKETGYEAENSFDGDPDTFWHTEWSSPTPDPCHPHWIEIDLGGFYDICGFRYLPRQDVSENGMIKDYEFYVSDDPCDWGTAVASGTWAKDKTEKQVSFDSTLGQYVRLIAISEVNGNPWTTMAELNVLAVQPDSDINNDGKVNIEDFAVLAAWWDDENARSSPDWCEGADFNMSGTVDMLDLTYFAENWLR